MLSFRETPLWSMGLIQLYTWMTWIAHSMTGDLSSSGSSDLSHIVFDSSYVSDTRDWFESILIVMDQELWYDPTLGHSHLREFYYRMTIMSRHTLLSRWRIFLSHVHSSEDIRCPFSHWSMRHDWCLSSAVLYTGAYAFRSMMVFLSVVVPWRRLDSFHIGVRDMIGWYLWYDHRSITLSSSVTYFWDDWIRTRTLMRAYNGV